MSRLYSKEHEWIEAHDGVATVGISDHAQEQLGELVFVELPEVGRRLAAGEEAATIESVKAASEAYAPAAGEVSEVNAALGDDPGLVNRDPEGEGWLFKLKIGDGALPETLMSAEQYKAFIADDN